MNQRDVLLVIDMQVALFAGSTKWDAGGLMSRINRLARAIRRSGGHVIFVRHTAESGDFKADTPGWQILPELDVDEQDVLF